MEDDDIVDVMEREIEDKAIRLIAMQQPISHRLKKYIYYNKNSNGS